MIRRSKANYEAALFLLQKRCYDGSIVAFYYSVLQRMMYALNHAEKHPLPYERQNPLNENLPLKILTEIKNRIQNNREKDSIQSLFEELLALRKKADYQQDLVTQDECTTCRSLCEDLTKKLDRVFSIK